MTQHSPSPPSAIASITIRGHIFRPTDDPDGPLYTCACGAILNDPDEVASRLDCGCLTCEPCSVAHEPLSPDWISAEEEPAHHG